MIQILKRLFLRARFRGKGVTIERHCRVALTSHFEGKNVVCEQASFSGFLGYGSYIGEHSKLHAKVGRFCSIAGHVQTISGTHPSRQFVSTHPAFFSTRGQSGETFVTENAFCEFLAADPDSGVAVVIGNDVWIGQRALILGGITIGDGAIVAAGAVVTRNVPPYTVVAGVPAKAIRKRFTDAQIDFLLRFRWWEKDRDWWTRNARLFGDIERFMSAFADESPKANI